MTKPSLTLWLLNRAVDWDHGTLAQALAEKHDVRIGRRVMAQGECCRTVRPNEVPIAVNAGEDSAPGELMHEGAGRPKDHASSYDEYFMPVPMKCVGAIGSDFWAEMGASAAGRMTELAYREADRFRSGAGGTINHDPARAEAIIGEHFGRVRMNLADEAVGYYEVLQRAKSRTGAMNVLVGYSQGGVVARYLAFLDEHVAAPERACIHGIVTVQSPNAGSPMASSVRKQAVGSALAAVLLSILRWLPPDFRERPIWPLLGNAPTVDAVNALLDALLHSWPADAPRSDAWLTARKWLSGLEGVPALAFWDLDPARAKEVGSVLHAIATHPLIRIKHGAVIGTDSSLVDLVLALLDRAPWLVRKAVRWKRDLLEIRLREAESIYRVEAMGLEPYRPWPQLKENGLDRPLDPQAHDYVIPATSQMLLPVTSVHIGNVVNTSADHLSGAQGGDVEMVCGLLRRM